MRSAETRRVDARRVKHARGPLTQRPKPQLHRHFTYARPENPLGIIFCSFIDGKREKNIGGTVVDRRSTGDICFQKFCHDRCQVVNADMTAVICWLVKEIFSWHNGHMTGQIDAIATKQTLFSSFDTNLSLADLQCNAEQISRTHSSHSRRRQRNTVGGASQKYRGLLMDCWFTSIGRRRRRPRTLRLSIYLSRNQSTILVY